MSDFLAKFYVLDVERDHFSCLEIIILFQDSVRNICDVEIPTGTIGEIHFHFGTRARPSAKTPAGAGEF